MIGKDVTKIALPVHLNEPLSFTQVCLGGLSAGDTVYILSTCAHACILYAYV